MTELEPGSVDLRSRSNGGVYRWRRFLALLTVSGVDRLLFPPAAPSVSDLLQAGSQAAVRRLDAIANSRSEPGETSTEAFFSASEAVIRETLLRIQREIGTDFARAVYEYGLLTDTSREFAWKILLRRLAKAAQKDRQGYSQQDIPLRDRDYRRLLDLVNIHLSDAPPDRTVDQLRAIAAAVVPGGDPSGMDPDSVFDHLNELVYWRAVNDLFGALRGTVDRSAVDQLVDWAQLRAKDLQIDPVLLWA